MDAPLTQNDHSRGSSSAANEARYVVVTIYVLSPTAPLVVAFDASSVTCEVPSTNGCPQGGEYHRCLYPMPEGEDEMYAER